MSRQRRSSHHRFHHNLPENQPAKGVSLSPAHPGIESGTRWAWKLEVASQATFILDGSQAGAGRSGCHQTRLLHGLLP